MLTSATLGAALLIGNPPARAGLDWPDARRRLVLDTDPYQPLQWHLDNDGSLSAIWPEIAPGAHIGVHAAWESTRGDPGVVVAILDTGFPAGHPDLPAWVQPFDAIDGDDDPAPPGTASLDAHGTAVAALVLAPENGSGVIGVCPLCTLLPVRMLASDATSRDGHIVAALEHAAAHADVILASWSFDELAYVAPGVHEAIRRAARQGRGGRGAVVVFSAGNRGRDIDPYVPQAMADVVAVGATDERDLRAGYSNRGVALRLMAPGGTADTFRDGERQPHAKLVTADLVGEAGNSPHRDASQAPGIVDDHAVTATFSGTSAAAPLVAGAAALLIARRPELTANEVVWILTESAAKVGGVSYDANGRHPDYGHGRLDAGAALRLLDGGAYCRESPEVCDNLADDDCDRRADAVDPDCGGADARPFEVTLGIPCGSDDECGDGLCTDGEGPNGARFCSALCDFDCPADGACVGSEGVSRCHPICSSDADCEADFACAVPDPALVPPGQTPVALCLARCSRDDHCDTAHCRDHHVCAAAAAKDLELPPPGPPGSGCDCAASPAPVALLAALPLLARRRRALRAGAAPEPVGTGDMSEARRP